MTETTPDYQTAQPTALDNLGAQRLTDLSVFKQSNWLVYEQLLGETAQLLSGTAQLTQDVLHQICVEHGAKPADVLLLVHDFLATFQTYQEREQIGGQVEEVESPFFARGGA